MEWEGEQRPQHTDADMLALEGYSMLANGMGGLDWAGLPVVCELLGVHDVEAFVRALVTIKTHRPDVPGCAQ